MSSSAEADHGPACRRCGARPASRAWLFVLGVTMLTLGFLPLDPGPLCEECRDRANFVGLLFVCVAVAVVVLVTFVILVD